MPDDRCELVLASSSLSRRAILESAGLPFRIQPSSVDEDEVRDRLAARDPNTDPAQIAAALAQAKAEQVSRSHSGSLVIGADQTLALAGTLVNKAPDLPAARARLLEMRGREHRLHSAVALAHEGATQCVIVDSATLVMRRFTESFLDSYLERAGERVLSSVGCYEIEGLGIQLFESVQGDHFTIMGLPLLPLLAALRARGVVPV